LKNFRTPYFFVQPLKLTTSNLVDNFGYNNNFSTELGRGWLGYRSTSKIVGITYYVVRATYFVPGTLYHVTATEM